MALTKQKKSEIVSEVTTLISDSKLTVLASYPGTSVKDMQALRKVALEGNTVVRVIKNRLFVKALKDTNKFPEIDFEMIKGQLLYAFNPSDEVAPAQVLSDFAKKNQTLEFIGALSEDGNFLNAAEVQELANLPSKDQLRGQLVGLLGAPLSGMVNVVAGNIRGVLNVLNNRAENIG